MSREAKQVHLKERQDLITKHRIDKNSIQGKLNDANASIKRLRKEKEEFEKTLRGELLQMTEEKNEVETNLEKQLKALSKTSEELKQVQEKYTETQSTLTDRFTELVKT